MPMLSSVSTRKIMSQYAWIYDKLERNTATIYKAPTKKKSKMSPGRRIRLELTQRLLWFGNDHVIENQALEVIPLLL